MENKTLETKKFKKVKSLKDIENDPRVTDIYKDEDGWWGSLADGYEWCPEAQIFRENTIKEMCYVLNELVYQKNTEEMKSISDFQEAKPKKLGRNFSRVDEKDKWVWDFKYNGFQFWITGDKSADGVWKFMSYYDGEELEFCFDTRKWYGWEVRANLVNRFFSDRYN